MTDYYPLISRHPTQQPPQDARSSLLQTRLPQGRKGQRKLEYRRRHYSNGLISSTAETLLSLLADNLGGVYGPNAHLATLGEALVQVWVKAFKVFAQKYQNKGPYIHSRDALGADLQRLCQHMKLNLEHDQHPTEKL